MSIAEIRTAVTSAEELEMKAQRFIESRIEHRKSKGADFTILGCPLLLEDGRINIEDARLPALFREPPTFRPTGFALSTRHNFQIHPTLRGLVTVLPQTQELEIFRNGHVEFSVLRHGLMTEHREGDEILIGWAVAEQLRNFAHFVAALREITEIGDPYLFVGALLNCGTVRMSETGLNIWGLGRIEQWTEPPHILLDPILAQQDESPDRTAQRIADRFWNAFHFPRVHSSMPMAGSSFRSVRFASRC
jgi:hypothetical protein